MFKKKYQIEVNEKEFNREDAKKIHKRIKLEYEKAHKKKNREDR